MRKQMNCLVVFGFMVLMVIGVYAAEEKKIEVESKVSAVTVYTDRAMVTRQAELKSNPGIYNVIFKDLPAGIDDRTIRASGTGGAAVKILGVKIERQPTEKPPEERLKQLESELLGLKDQERSLNDALEVLKTEKEFLLSIKLGTATEIPKELTRQKPSVEDWKSLLTFLDENLRKNAEAIRGKEIERRELNDKIQAKQREYNLAAQGYRPKERKIVTVSVEISQPAELNLNISYVIYGAAWQPQYDARVLTAEKKVELIYYGIVSQNTGEDWNNVSVSLSTAQPAVGARMPELPPAYAVLGIPSPEDMPIGGMFGQTEEDKNRPASKVVRERLKHGDYEAKDEIAQMAQANVQHQLTSAVYKVEKKENIPSDGVPHKTTIAQKFFEMTPEYVTTPKLAPYAYLKTDVVNNSELTLLAGNISVFLGMDFTGAAWTKTVAQNEKFELFLGTDENVKVERKLEEKKEEAPGFLGSKQTVYYTYKFKLENFQKEKVKLTVLDQVPVSQVPEIEVGIDEKTTAKWTEKGKDGQLKWIWELAPGEKKEFFLKFWVSYPKDKEIFIQGMGF